MTQLSLPLVHVGPEAEADRLTEQSLEVMKCRVYVCTVARGHRTWADGCRPSLDCLLRYREYLADHPQDTGHLYYSGLVELIEEYYLENNRTKVPTLSSYRKVTIQEELAVGVHVTCLTRTQKSW